MHTHSFLSLKIDMLRLQAHFLLLKIDMLRHIVPIKLVMQAHFLALNIDILCHIVPIKKFAMQAHFLVLKIYILRHIVHIKKAMQAHVLHLKIDILRHIVPIFRTPRNVCVDKIQSRHLGVFKVYTLFLWDFLSKWPAQRENVLRYMPFLIGFLKYMARAAPEFFV